MTEQTKEQTYKLRIPRFHYPTSMLDHKKLDQLFEDFKTQKSYEIKNEFDHNHKTGIGGHVTTTYTIKKESVSLTIEIDDQYGTYSDDSEDYHMGSDATFKIKGDDSNLEQLQKKVVTLFETLKQEYEKKNTKK